MVVVWCGGGGGVVEGGRWKVKRWKVEGEEVKSEEQAEGELSFFFFFVLSQ